MNILVRIIWHLASMTGGLSTVFFIDYGLREQENGFFSALDGTGVLLRGRDDPSLPAALPSGSQLRKPSMAWRIAPRLRLLPRRCAAIAR